MAHPFQVVAQAFCDGDAAVAAAALLQKVSASHAVRCHCSGIEQAIGGDGMENSSDDFFASVSDRDTGGCCGTLER